jgi:MFS family permease
MKTTHSSRVALALLRQLAHRNEPLAGDLLEEFHNRQSGLWLWSQLLLAVVMGSFREPRVPVALNLTPIDPAVAEWLMDRALTRKRVTLTGTSVEGVGGISLMTLGFLLSTVVPDVWWFVLGGIVCGIILGTTMAFTRRDKGLRQTRLILN